MDLRILRLLKRVYSTRRIDRKELGRDHYFSSQNKGFIFETIQPVHEVDHLIPLDFGGDTAVVSSNTATVTIEPKNEDELWEIHFVSVLHDDVAAKNILVRYVRLEPTVQQNLTSSSGHAIPKAVITPVFPVLYDITGVADHEHTVSPRPLPVEKGKKQLKITILAATNGKTLTVSYVYKRLI